MSEGEKIFLRALELNDLDLIHKWQTDDNINKLTGGNKFFISKERVKRWIEDKIHNDTKQIYCAICECQSGNMIGYASLNNIDFINRKADWGGILIGDYEARNRGFASQAATLLMRHGFFELGLQKISGKFISSHQVSIFMAKMLGFKVEGTLRREVFKNNAYHDILLMSILKEEFEIKLSEIK